MFIMELLGIATRPRTPAGMLISIIIGFIERLATPIAREPNAICSGELSSKPTHFHMFTMGWQKSKITRMVVGWIMISVVDNFIGRKEAPQYLFHYKAMLSNISTIVCERMAGFLYKYIAIFVNHPPAFPVIVFLKGSGEFLSSSLGGYLPDVLVPSKKPLCPLKNNLGWIKNTMFNYTPTTAATGSFDSSNSFLHTKKYTIGEIGCQV